MINSRSIDDLRADVRENCKTLIERCKAAGLNVLVTQTLRDNEYQAQLYAQGRTKPGSIVTNAKTVSFHGCGLAFDFCKNVKGAEYSDAAFFGKVAKLAKEMGFSWGGDWKSFVDKPHLQWDDGGKLTDAQVRAGKRPRTMPHWSWKEEEVVTQEDFNRMMDAYLAERAKQLPSDWSIDARLWAEKEGIVRGDGKTMGYKSFATKEEVAIMLSRAVRGVGK